MDAKAFVLARFLANFGKGLASTIACCLQLERFRNPIFIEDHAYRPQRDREEFRCVPPRERHRSLSGKIGRWSVGLHDAFERFDSIPIAIDPWNYSHAGVGCRTRLCRSGRW